jgi:class 3 adenylate cyclase
MFADIVDSTRLTAVIGDEDWIRVRARCVDLLRECYEAHGGSEVNSKGDGFLARFTTPAGAVRCAIEVHRRLHDQRREIGFAPSLRIGINRGDAMDEQGDLLGTVVNVASRVMSEAQPGEILTTEAVADHLDDRFVLEDRGLLTLKGMTRPCHVLSVNWSA